MMSKQYRDFHDKDKMVSWPSYLCDWIPHTLKEDLCLRIETKPVFCSFEREMLIFVTYSTPVCSVAWISDSKYKTFLLKKCIWKCKCYLQDAYGGNFSQILTHWGRVTHICVGNLAVIGSENGFYARRHQTIIWTNDGLLSIGHLWTNFSGNLFVIHAFSFRKMSSGKWRPFCLSHNVWNLNAPSNVHELVMAEKCLNTFIVKWVSLSVFVMFECDSFT